MFFVLSIFFIFIVILLFSVALAKDYMKLRRKERNFGYGLGRKESGLKQDQSSEMDAGWVEIANIIYKNSKLNLSEATQVAQAICVFIKEKKEQPCKTSKHI